MDTGKIKLEGRMTRVRKVDIEKIKECGGRGYQEIMRRKREKSREEG